MDIAQGATKLLLVPFGADYEGLTTVGYKLKNPDNTTTPLPAQPRTTTGVFDLGNGTYGVEYTAPMVSGNVIAEWDTGGADPIYAWEDVNITAATDLSSINAALTSMSASMAAINTNFVDVLGLNGKNLGMKNSLYDAHNLVEYDLYIYDTNPHALANDGVTGVIAHYHVVNTYNPTGDTLTQRMVKVS